MVCVTARLRGGGALWGSKKKSDKDLDCPFTQGNSSPTEAVGLASKSRSPSDKL